MFQTFLVFFKINSVIWGIYVDLYRVYGILRPSPRSTPKVGHKMKLIIWSSKVIISTLRNNRNQDYFDIKTTLTSENDALKTHENKSSQMKSGSFSTESFWEDFFLIFPRGFPTYLIL